MIRGLVALAALAAVSLAAVSDADACACCDGHTEIRALGWTQSGGSVLLENEIVEGCETKRFLSIQRARAAAPLGCYDLGANVHKRIACDDVSFFEEDKAPTTRSRAWRWFPHRAKPLPADVVRARAARKKDKWGVSVDVRVGGVWTTIWRKSLVSGSVIGEENADRVAHGVRIYPSPGRDIALLLVSGSYVDPGHGHFDTEVVWIKLPAGVEKTGGDLAAARQAVPVFGAGEGKGKREVSADGRNESRYYNRRGLARHRKGEYGAAIGAFVDALYADPSNPMPRYNLACSMARAGLPNRAIDQLAEIAASGCKRCGERLERAKVDEDLASLRGDVRFRKLVGK